MVPGAGTGRETGTISEVFDIESCLIPGMAPEHEGKCMAAQRRTLETLNGSTMTNNASIICLGHAALDRIYGIPAFPSVPEKVTATTMEEVGGGMAANAAVAAARLGASVAFYGRVGSDLAGQAIREGLQREGIDVAQLRHFDGGISSTSAVIRCRPCAEEEHHPRLSLGVIGSAAPCLPAPRPPR